jgi:hypothetical protein
VTFTVHGIDPANPNDYYYFGFSTEKYLKGGIKFPVCGPGAQFIPDLTADWAGICVSNQNPFVIHIPGEFAGMTFICQAIVPDPKAQGGFSFSKVFEIDFYEETIEPENFKLETKGFYNTLGIVTDYFEHDGTYYLLSNDYGILWLDRTNPAKPKIDAYQDMFAGELDMKNVSVEGSRGIVTNDASLYTFTIAGDKSIHYQGEKQSYKKLLADCVLKGNHAYVCDYANYVQIYNVADLANPVEAGSFTLSGYIYQMERFGDDLYIRTNSAISVYDLSNPTNPALIRQINGDFYVEDFLVIGDYLFFTDTKYDMLRCFKANSSQNFNEIISEPVDDCRNIELLGNHLYVNRYKKGFYVYDVSNIHSGYVTFLADLGNTAKVKDVVMVPAQNHMYAYMKATSSSAESPFVVMDDQSLVMLPYSDLNQYGMACSICVIDDYAVISRKDNGVEVYDISAPNKIVKTDHYLTESIHVVSHGNYIYSASCLDGVEVFQLSGQGKLSKMNHFATFGVTFNLDVSDNCLYVSNGYAGLQIYDLGNPQNPNLIHEEKNLDDSVVDVFLDHGLAFVLTGKSLYAFAVASSQTPSLRGQIDLSPYCFSFNGLSVYHGVAYICTNSYGVAIVDVSDETDMQFLEKIPLLGEITDAALFQEYILFSNGVASSGNGIEKAIYNYNNKCPESPAHLMDYEHVFNCNHAMNIRGDQLLILDDTSVVIIADFSE